MSASRDDNQSAGRTADQLLHKISELIALCKRRLARLEAEHQWLILPGLDRLDLELRGEL